MARRWTNRENDAIEIKITRRCSDTNICCFSRKLMKRARPARGKFTFWPRITNLGHRENLAIAPFLAEPRKARELLRVVGVKSVLLLLGMGNHPSADRVLGGLHK
jgi:hypothetical protein